MKDYKKIERKITNNIVCKIKAVDEFNQLEEEVYAINWFSTKLEWMYTLYNLLAAKSLTKVGGHVFFKGKLLKTLHGNPESTRELVLIVNYPSPNKFLDLLQDKYFQFISIFRLLAVDKFTFGFSTRISKQRPKRRDKLKSHAIHHFRISGRSDHYIKTIEGLSVKFDIDILFIGAISSLLSTQTKNGKEEQIPCLMDVVILFEANNEDLLEGFLTGKEYIDQTNGLESSYSALIKRLI